MPSRSTHSTFCRGFWVLTLLILWIIISMHRVMQSFLVSFTGRMSYHPWSDLIVAWCSFGSIFRPYEKKNRFLEGTLTMSWVYPGSLVWIYAKCSIHRYIIRNTTVMQHFWLPRQVLTCFRGTQNVSPAFLHTNSFLSVFGPTWNSANAYLLFAKLCATHENNNSFLSLGSE